MTLEEGENAPAISAPNQNDETVELDFEEPTVLYFYPRDETTGCTIEANEFENALETYHEAGLSVYGVSTDDTESHRAFARKETLTFDLLADPEGTIAESFEVDIDPESRTTSRTTFLLNDGEIVRVYTDVDAEGHAEAVLRNARDDGLTAETN